MIHKHESDLADHAASNVPYVRRGAPPELWQRIEAPARRSARRRRIRAAGTRAAACALGFVVWLACASLLRSRVEPSAPTVAAPHQAAGSDLPPEARLVALLFENEGNDR
jgi:hypothetical protein